MQLKLAAERIKQANKIYVVAGAGISVACGIPDFRSPGTGLYDNLQKYNLSTPTDMFDIQYYQMRPRPCSELTGAIFPCSDYKPSYTHCFLRLLQDKNKLQMVTTQNIDDIEKHVGVKKLFQAHGSFTNQMRCLKCKYTIPPQVIKQVSEDKAVVHCQQCGYVMKPGVVFFGEMLPSEVSLQPKLIQASDLVIVMGTSMQVAPVSTFPLLMYGKVPRVLINNQVVGNFQLDDSDAEAQFQELKSEKVEKDLDMKVDACCIGACDDISKQLCKELGWLNELEQLYQQFQQAKPAPKQPRDEKLTTVCLGGCLIVPTAQTFSHNGQQLMACQVTEEQFNLLKQKAKQTVVQTDDFKSQLISVTKNTPIFVVEGDVYKPFGGHYATYLTKFVNCVALDQETDVWDCISRMPEIKVNEEFEIAKTEPGTISYKDLQQFLSVNFTEAKYEIVEVEPLKYQNEKADLENFKMTIKLKFDQETEEKLQQKVKEKSFMQTIQDSVRTAVTTVKLIENGLKIEFGGDLDQTQQNVVKQMVARMLEKIGVTVDKK